MIDRVPTKTRDAVGTQSGTQSTKPPANDCVPSPLSRGDADAVAGGRTQRTHTKNKVDRVPRNAITTTPSNDPNWRQRAACKGMPINLFYPDKFDTASPNHANPSNAAREMVKQMCQSCPVRVACLVAAVAEGEADAVRAGLEFGRTPERRWGQQLVTTALRVGNGRIDERQTMEILSRIDDMPRKANR